MKKAAFLKKDLQPTQGERAFIYQQASDLPAPVLVLMEQAKGGYNVTFVIDPLNNNLRITGSGSNIVEACMAAKKTAQKKIAQLTQLSQDDEEREFLFEMAQNRHSAH